MITPEVGAELLFRLGLSTEALGPIEEWSPVPPCSYQRRHNEFWSTVAGLLPDNEEDEQPWMTEEATQALREN